MQKYEWEKRQEMRRLEYEACTRELHGCSFMPTVHSIRGQDSQDYRSAEEFYGDQMRFARNRDRKIGESVKERDTIRPDEFVPKVDKRSERLISARRSGSIHEHLYSAAKHLRSGSVREPMKELSLNLSFNPEINERSKRLRRGSTVDSLLYGDAKRRAQSLSRRQAEEQLRLQAQGCASHVLDKSETCLADRFSHEFDRAFDRASRGACLLSYLKTAELLTMMGFMDGGKDKGELSRTSSHALGSVTSSVGDASGARANSEGALLYDMWQVLRGEDLGGVSRRNLRAFLLAVMGIYQPWMEQTNPGRACTKRGGSLMGREDWTRGVSAIPESDETEPRDELGPATGAGDGSRGGFREDSEVYCVRRVDVRNIHSYFMQFYQNRTSRGQTAKSTEGRDERHYSFRPKICPTSRQLAVNYLNKSINQMSVAFDKPIYPSEVTHSDLMWFKSIEYDTKKAKERDRLKAEESRNLSFVPKITEYKPPQEFGRRNLKQLEKFWRVPASTRNCVSIPGSNTATTALAAQHTMQDNKENSSQDCIGCGDITCESNSRKRPGDDAKGKMYITETYRANEEAPMPKRQATLCGKEISCAKEKTRLNIAASRRRDEAKLVRRLSTAREVTWHIDRGRRRRYSRT